MAERRMFAKTIIDSDAFIDMPTTARLLYYDLSMRADDDGFINAPKKICRMTGASDDDLKILIMKRFIIPFESGVVVIKHWKIHNYIRQDRYKETEYREEKAQLRVKENKAYSFVGVPGIPTVDQRETQVRLGKDRLGEVRIEEDIEPPTDKPPTPPVPAPAKTKIVRKKYGQYGWVLLTDEEYQKLVDDLGEAETLRCIKYVDESAQGNGNKNKWKDWNLVVRKCHRDGWGLSKGGYRKPAPPTREEMDAQRKDGADWMARYVKPAPKTAADDPDIKARAAQLQRDLKGR